MTGRWPTALAAALALSLATLPALASGVFVVTRKGVPAYEDAKNGFIQMAYAQQIKGFSPQAVELDGTDKDGGALDALKAKAPDLVFCIGSYAAKKVRGVLPETPIVYAMAYYPEAEGLTSDTRMVGIHSLGAPRKTVQLLKDSVKVKGVTVLHHASIAASANSIADSLSAEGLSATTLSVKDAAGLQGALGGLGGGTAVLLLPDPLTLDPEALRFIISHCLKSGLVPISFTENLVSNGALFAAFFPPSATGNKAAEVAAQVLAAGKVPDVRLVYPALSDATTAMNKSTASALRVKPSKEMGGGIVYE